MYSNTQTQNHPLPAPPGQTQEYRPQQRDRSQSSFTIKSHKSSNSGGKHDLHETHEEKKHLTTHADPSMAMTELEPSAVARQQTNLAPIRAIQHRDHLGNPIADPDRSNPTRNRWERPLDTIRSFEAAIDGNYRKSYIRNDSEGSMNLNRRSSYFGGTQVTTDDRARFSQNGQSGFYGGRPQSQRPDSFVDGRRSYYNSGENGQGQGPSNGYYPSRSRYPRTASEPQFNPGKGVYPGTGNQPSYETVTTASGSGTSGEPAGYTTDPSSENSSMDRITPLPQTGENYGFIGFNGVPEHSQASHGYTQQEPRQVNGQKPTTLRKENSGPRVPIKLGQTSGNAGPPPVQRPAAAEKRKTWLSRRFSKSG